MRHREQPANRNGLTRRGALAAVLTIAAAVAVLAQAPSTLRPVDDAPRDGGFLAFRTALQQTVARRDEAALLAAVHPDIKNSFGGDDGREAFRRGWRLGQKDSAVWAEMGSLLLLGGTFQTPDLFVAPYVFSRWPDSVDAFEHVAVLGTNVRIRSAASATAPILATVSHAILPLNPGVSSRDWTRVRLPGGRAGFVVSRLVRSPIGYRAFFARADGGWQMTALLKGD